MRKTTLIVVYMAFMDATAIALEESGFAQAAGIDTGITAGGALENAAEAAGQISAGGGLGSTLFGLYNSIAGGLQALFEGATAAPQMIMAAGAPWWATVGFFGTPILLFVGLDIAYALTGRDL